MTQFRRVDSASLASRITISFIKICNTVGGLLNPARMNGRRRKKILSGVNTSVIFTITNLALWRDTGTQCRLPAHSRVILPPGGRGSVAKKLDPQRFAMTWAGRQNPQTAERLCTQKTNKGLEEPVPELRTAHFLLAEITGTAPTAAQLRRRAGGAKDWGAPSCPPDSARGNFILGRPGGAVIPALLIYH